MYETRRRLREGHVDQPSTPSTPLNASTTLTVPVSPGSAFAASLQMLLTMPSERQVNMPLMTPGRITEEQQKMKDEKAVDAELYAYENESIKEVKTYLKGGSDALLTYWAVSLL